MARRTRSRVALCTPPSELTTRETVFGETSASAATSSSVAGFPPCALDDLRFDIALSLEERKPSRQETIAERQDRSSNRRRIVGGCRPRHCCDGRYLRGESSHAGIQGRGQLIDEHGGQPPANQDRFRVDQAVDRQQGLNECVARFEDPLIDDAACLGLELRQTARRADSKPVICKTGVQR